MTWALDLSHSGLTLLTDGEPIRWRIISIRVGCCRIRQA